jgi:hypothetical protein
MYLKVSISISNRRICFHHGSIRVWEINLLNILGILDNYDTGEYYLNNVLIKNLSETKLPNTGIA